MKKTFLASFCIVGFMLIAGPIFMKTEFYPVVINGKPFANAVMINGVLAISVADLANTFGVQFQVQGNKLSTPGHLEASATPNTIGGRDAASGLPTGKRMHKPFVITKTIDVSTAVITKNGKTFVPFADVVTAFGGGVFKPGTLRPGQTLTFNFAPNANAAFAVGQ